MPTISLKPQNSTPKKPIGAITLIVQQNMIQHHKRCLNGPLHFPIPKPEAKTRKANPNAQLECDSVTLFGGSQTISLGDYEALQRSGWFQEMRRQGVIQVVEPKPPEDGEAAPELTGTTADYDDDDAIRIVENAADEELLRKAKTFEKRQHILDAIASRLAEIKEHLASLDR